MENTSNALIIAGEILIAVLILSLFAYIVLQFGSFSAQMHEEMIESQIASFNNNFTVYSYRTNITAQEIATVINFAKQSNDDKELNWNDSSDYYINVYIDGQNVFNSGKYAKSKDEYENSNKFDEIIRKFIKENNIKYFSCNALVKNGNKVELNDNDITFNNVTDQVNRIEFHSIDTSKKNIPDSF